MHAGANLKGLCEESGPRVRRTCLHHAATQLVAAVVTAGESCESARTVPCSRCVQHAGHPEVLMTWYCVQGPWTALLSHLSLTLTRPSLCSQLCLMREHLHCVRPAGKHKRGSSAASHRCGVQLRARALQIKVPASFGSYTIQVPSGIILLANNCKKRLAPGSIWSRSRWIFE